MKGAGMKLVYIASPLRGDYSKNIKKVIEYCQKACSLGVRAFAPHLYFTQFYNDTIPEQTISAMACHRGLWVQPYSQRQEGLCHQSL